MSHLFVYEDDPAQEVESLHNVQVLEVDVRETLSGPSVVGCLAPRERASFPPARIKLTRPSQVLRVDIVKSEVLRVDIVKNEVLSPDRKVLEDPIVTPRNGHCL